jgi:hypothetical protein
MIADNQAFDRRAKSVGRDGSDFRAAGQQYVLWLH